VIPEDFLPFFNSRRKCLKMEAFIGVGYNCIYWYHVFAFHKFFFCQTFEFVLVSYGRIDHDMIGGCTMKYKIRHKSVSHD